MKIAIASQNFRTIFGHAGKARRFLVYDVKTPCSDPIEINRLDLPPEYAFHGFDDRLPHPLDGVDLLIVGGCGAGFLRRMATRGIEVIATGEEDPVAAIRGYFNGNLPPAQPHDHGSHAHEHSAH